MSCNHVKILPERVYRMGNDDHIICSPLQRRTIQANIFLQVAMAFPVDGCQMKVILLPWLKWPGQIQRHLYKCMWGKELGLKHSQWKWPSQSSQCWCEHDTQQKKWVSRADFVCCEAWSTSQSAEHYSFRRAMRQNHSTVAKYIPSLHIAAVFLLIYLAFCCEYALE
jgi:hypothetical protein